MESKKRQRRFRIKQGIRKKIRGSADRPRLSIFRSNKDIYVQIINDDDGVTIIGHSSRAKGFKGSGNKSDHSRQVGKEIAELAQKKGVESVIFDRNGFKYHGRIKALAEGAREGGLKF